MKVSGRGMADRLSRLSLRWRIGAFVLLGLAAIFTLFGVLGYELAIDGRQRTVSQWLGMTSATARFIDVEIEEQFDRLVALDTQLARAPDTSRSQVLSDLASPNTSLVAGTFILDSRGSLTWSDTTLASGLAAFVAADTDIAAPLRSGSRYASGVESFGGRSAVVLAIPLHDRLGAVVGVAGTIIRPDAWIVDDLVTSAHGLATTGHAELIDQHGNVIVSSEPDHVMGPGEHPDFYMPLLAGHRTEAGLTQPVGPIDPDDQGQRHEMAFVALANAPWGLALGGADAELSADANRWQLQIALFGAVTLLLALVLVWMTTRSVARPIRALTAASKSIAAGDLGTAVPRAGEGEVGELATAFDQMRIELQKALTKLALEESRYEGIVTSMADAVVTTDRDRRITALNPSAERLTGWHIGTAIADSSSLTRKEIIRRPDGSDAVMAITRSAIRDRNGELAGTVHVLRDISAEEEVSRLKDEFLSTVSHELRTPLGFIMGYATTLLRPDAPQDQAAVRRCIETIADASKELEELVDNLLDMTKIGAGSLSVSQAEARIDLLARSAIERVRIRSTSHQFALHASPDLPHVWVDAHRIGQVLYNLIDNAIKYSPDGGLIEVDIRAVGGDIVLSVVDEGLGIPHDEQQHLFERFQRGKNARTRGIGGSGLGLAICKGIVKAHGGLIWVESPVAHATGQPRGTAIRLTLPAVHGGVSEAAL